MPRAVANGIGIHYEQAGAGPDLLLIAGLGSNHLCWRPLVPGLSDRFRVTMFDNRGAGLSDKPEGPYDMAMLAADAAGLLEALGIARAHVFGISMGGMVAQHLALRWPERVGRLVLGCTSPGGLEAVHPEPWVMEVLLRPREGRAPEEIYRDALPILFSPEFVASHPAEVASLCEAAGNLPTLPRCVKSQMAAVFGHDALEALRTLRAPTLVLTGEKDVLVPPENSDRIAAAIPGARLVRLPGAAHAFIAEAPDAVASALCSFLLDEDPATAGLSGRCAAR